jgi:hypothetical protein
MDEYIKREDALDAVLFALVGTGHQSKAIYAIRDVPTADVIPKEFLTRKEDEAYERGYAEGKSDAAREILAEIEVGVKAAVSALQFENNPIHRKVKHETYSSFMRFIKTMIEQKYTEVSDD